MAICGVNQKEYTAYNFDDHLWVQNAQTDLLELAQRCVLIDGEYYLQTPNTGLWERFKTLPLARAQAVNTWLNGRLSSGTIIDYDLIKTFFSGKLMEEISLGGKIITKETAVGSCPMLSGFIVIPYGPRFVRFNGLPYLNMAVMDMQEGRADDVVWGRALLRLIYRSLCDGKPLSDDPVVESNLLLEQVITDRYSNIDFRFILNWLAALVQFPGVNLQTNLWLVGRQQGVGKGTLCAVMRDVLGSNLVGALNQAEIEAGWNDHIVGKVLINCDEIGEGRMSKRAWDRWIKEHSCERLLKVRKRNTTSMWVLNISNYLFTTNDEQPSYMDRNDRRNVVIKTTDDPYGAAFASVLRRRLNSDDDNRIVAGFAYVLEQVKVDFDLLGSAYTNQAKANIVAAQIDHVESWAREDARIDRDVWIAGAALYERFRAWFDANFPSEKVMSNRKFGEHLGKLEGRGVAWRKGRLANEWWIGEITDLVVKDERDEACQDVAGIIDEQISFADYDQPVDVAPAVPWTDLTTLERLQARLISDSKRGRG